MKILILALIFQNGAYEIMGTNKKNLAIKIERVKKGTFKLVTSARVGDCRVDPMDALIEPAFQSFQHRDRKMFTTMLVGMKGVDTNIYVQCELL